MKLSDPLTRSYLTSSRDNVFCYETAPAQEAGVATVPVYLRERKNSSTYSPSNLFGQPFLISLPSTCTQDELYNCLLIRMARYSINSSATLAARNCAAQRCKLCIGMARSRPRSR